MIKKITVSLFSDIIEGKTVGELKNRLTQFSSQGNWDDYMSTVTFHDEEGYVDSWTLDLYSEKIPASAGGLYTSPKISETSINNLISYIEKISRR